MKVNWLALIIAAVVDWVLGGVWFTVFANPWKAGLRMSPEEIQAYQAHPNFWPYLVALLCSFLLAYVIARLLSTAEKYGLARGLMFGLLVGIAASAAMVTELVFELRPRGFIWISAGYPLVGCIIMGMIVGLWKPKVTTAKA